MSEKVLACLSKYVVFPSVNDFSIQLLDIPFTRISQIQVKFAEPTERILQVSASARTFLERPLKFSTKIGRKRQVTVQKRSKLNIKSTKIHERLTS